MSDTADDVEQPAVQQLYGLATDSLAEDCYTNNPPELAVLEGAYFGYRMGEHMATELLVATGRAVNAGLLRESPDGHGWAITEAGQLRLADLWGDHRVPPSKGGHVDCWVHGAYVAAPGDLWACPECPATDDEVLRQVEADAGPILRDVLADAEAQRLAVEPNIRRFEASQRRRKVIRKVVRLVVILAVLVMVLSVVATAAA